MKKITLSFFLLLITYCGFGQILIGNGNNQDQQLPFDPFYGYSYTQSIYLSSEINSSGTITGLQWYFSGTTLLPNSQDITIYLGHTTKTAFSSGSDWEPIGSLTSVYTGTIPVSGTGWVSITFDTPFVYNGTDNLVVAVDENLANYDTSSDDFHNTSVAGNRSLGYSNDGINSDPSSPEDGTAFAFVPNIILEGIVQACPAPTNFVVTNITSDSADLDWTENGSAFDWEYVVQAPGTGIPTGSGTAIDAQPWEVASGGGLTGLTPNTAYEVYIRSFCSVGNESNWVGPIVFTTSCLAFTVPFIESFNSTSTSESCWRTLNVNDDFYLWELSNNSAPQEGDESAAIYTDYNGGNNDDWLISPTITLTGNQRLKFYYRVESEFEPNDFELLLSTTGVSPSNFTTVLMPNTSYSNVDYVQQIIDLSSYSGDVNIAWHVPPSGLDGWVLYIDNVVIEDIPNAAPSCATNIVATPDASCGNFNNSISWDITSGADGYYISIGTTSGGVDVVDNLDLGNSTNYNFVGQINTSYYYTVVPYNAFGSATGCVESSFITNANGCYCTSNPSSNDDLGITNVDLITTSFPTSDVTYFDHTPTSVDMSQGISNNVQITFATGYTYDTYVLIDFNDDFDFEDAGELVFSGQSLSDNPTIYDASFIMPSSAPLGIHRMRIVTADDMTTVNPCYDGSYGVTLDFAINIVAASCTPVAIASINVTPDCNNSEFNVNIDITDLGDGTPSVSDGTNSWPINATGVVQVGPFAFGSSASLVLLHGTDNTCDLPLGTFMYGACPPLNDSCANAVVLTPGGTFVENSVSGTNLAATDSNETLPDCASYNGGDAWYQVAIPASGNLTIETNSVSGSSLTDTGMAVYSGSCGSLVLIECDDDDSADGNFSLVALTGRTAGEIVYVRVWEYGNDTFDTFQVSAYDASLNATSYDLVGFKAYPNPIKDMLNLEYSSNISFVRILNLLGQEVISKTINGSSVNIDMSELNSGTYIVNVVIDDNIQTIKVIKE